VGVALAAACTAPEPGFSPPPRDSYAPATFQVEGAGEPVAGAVVSSGFFLVGGLRPMLGRFPLDSEFAGEGRVAVLSQGLWTDRFGADPALIGRELTVNGRPAVVVGVTPEDFTPAGAGGLWLSGE